MSLALILDSDASNSQLGCCFNSKRICRMKGNDEDLKQVNLNQLKDDRSLRSTAEDVLVVVGDLPDLERVVVQV